MSVKPNQIMIGDILTFKDCQNDKEPVIIKIWQINQEGNALVFIDDSDSLDEIAIDDEIVGIHLTTEILEKNGFVEINDDKKWYKMKLLENNDFVGLEKLEDCYWMFGAVVFPNLINHLFIKYVHELQHILKLCGIEKTIEL